MLDNKAPAKPRNTAASWALGLGIIAIVMAPSQYGVGGLILIPGVITAVVGLNNARRINGAGQVRAIIGLVLTVIALVITIVRIREAFGS